MTKKESDLFEPVKAFFEEKGYEIFSEVIVRYSGGRVDVVAYAPPAAIAIELKTSLSIELIGQAIERQNVFPYVYIAIPYRRKDVPHWIMRHLAEKGIGVLYVTDGGWVKVVQRALYRKPPMAKHIKWADVLKEEHKTWLAGGSAGGGYVTPYRLTMQGVRHYLSTAVRIDDALQRQGVKKGDAMIMTEGWRTIAEILDHCETHYMTPKSSLAQALLEFESSWIEAKKDGGKWHFRHKGDEK